MFSARVGVKGLVNLRACGLGRTVDVKGSIFWGSRVGVWFSGLGWFQSLDSSILSNVQADMIRRWFSGIQKYGYDM